ncbi:unnamed protein product [Trifolium pratense]|uniref:Uncharacterized protein n=1 Tax=Trifolium pratense TaxID=57577 RepID=A0ACB0IX30_TRIPR|nr:unnamed protein product [Trifolium pratense]
MTCMAMDCACLTLRFGIFSLFLDSIFCYCEACACFMHPIRFVMAISFGALVIQFGCLACNMNIVSIWCSVTSLSLRTYFLKINLDLMPWLHCYWLNFIWMFIRSLVKVTVGEKC